MYVRLTTQNEKSQTVQTQDESNTNTKTDQLLAHEGTPLTLLYEHMSPLTRPVLHTRRTFRTFRTALVR
jgi:hypothetical protein